MQMPKLQPITAAERSSMIREIAARMCNERGGDGILQTLADIEDTLVMYRQDLARGKQNDNPQKFRWRVSPTVAQRLRKERKQLEAEYKELLAQCIAEAERMIDGMYPAPTDSHSGGEPADTEPVLEITSRQPAADTPAESEAATQAPPEAA